MYQPVISDCRPPGWVWWRVGQLRRRRSLGPQPVVALAGSRPGSRPSSPPAIRRLSRRRCRRCHDVGMGEVTDYIAGQEEPASSVLERYRTRALAVVSEAEEGRSYGMPALRYRGRPLVGELVGEAQDALLRQRGGEIESDEPAAADRPHVATRCRARPLTSPPRRSPPMRRTPRAWHGWSASAGPAPGWRRATRSPRWWPR